MSLKAHGNALPEGYRLHWYRIGRVLGQGGFGITYLATDTNLDRAVAIKEYLPIELAVREDGSEVHPFTEDRRQTFLWGLERFLTEARTLARFTHPNIVRVFAVFEANNTAYMVMAYEQGSSLDELIKFGRVEDEASLLRIVHPLLDGLGHVHDAGFIHRDVKPGNIYVRDDGSPVLLDFGSARMALGNQSRTLTRVVSSGFSPYEQYDAEEGKQGPWTDIYGLGATLYVALGRGAPPVDAVTRAHARFENRPDPMSPASVVGRGRYSRRFLDAVDAALALRPEDRPQSIAQWRAMLPAPGEAPGTHEAVTEPAPAAAITTPGAPARRRGAVGAVAVAVVLALLVGGWWYLGGRREPQAVRDTAPAAGDAVRAGQADATAEAVGDAVRAGPADATAEAAGDVARAGAAPGAAGDAVRDAPAARRESPVPRDTLKDGSAGPDLLRIPAGRFVMGSPPGEPGRADAEGPQREVSIGRDFALARFEVTVAEFRRFVDATGYTTRAETIGGCFSGQGRRDGATWRDPGGGRAQGEREPVVCVAWDDAVRYVQWLSEQTGARYRLPSEAEWEYAARGGTSGARYWGDHPDAACRHANVGDASRVGRGRAISGTRFDCDDGYVGLAPVGSFDANGLGLHDMLGNVWEWVADCWTDGYAGAPADGAPAVSGDCVRRVRRGGNASSGAEEIRSAARRKGRRPGVGIGLRVARDL